ncbi:MAG: hypothetical protein O3A93_14220 [Chloroflexi bacterium]|nr:hypothetical protein [Chloroflexota bacterium]
MTRTDTNANKILNGLGMMLAAPAILLVAAVAVVILSTPVMLAVFVAAFATAILFAGTVVTRQAPLAEATEEPIRSTTRVVIMDKPGDKHDREAAMCESIDLFAALESENVVMVEALTDAPKTPVSATITKVVGPCPLGMMPGNTWSIGPDGKLSRPLCRPGATALSRLFQMGNGEVMEESTRCQCVIAGREVTFTVREPV